VTDSVFLLVDNHADDLATFATSLACRYASEYEIRTAATASEAHATLAALSVAGITVALLVVSRDLGDPDLLLLLQRAREFFPSARRVLSARYVDPSAFRFGPPRDKSRMVGKPEVIQNGVLGSVSFLERKREHLRTNSAE
jgi:hypothetical protein